MAKFKVKDKWSEVTLRDWIKIGEVEKSEELAGLNLAKRIDTIAILSGWPIPKIERLKGAELAKMLSATQFLDKEPRKRGKKPFKISKEKDATLYMFHPEMNQLDLGEMASIEQLLIDEHNSKQSRFAELLTILVRPAIKRESKEFKQSFWEVEEFDVKGLDQRKELFLDHLTVDKFYHEMAFFLNLGLKSKELTHLSIQKEKLKTVKK